MRATATKPKAARAVNRAPQTGSPGGGKTTGQLVRESNRWRDNYNPMRALVIARVVAILEAAERGDFAELQLVMRKLEKRYPVLKGLKSRRLSALEKLDWDIKTVDAKKLPPGATKEMADAQQKFLRSRYDLIENLSETFGFLVTPEFRGYAIAQKHRFEDGGANDGAVREFHWLPQDQFSRAGSFGDFYYNKDSRFGICGDGCAASLGEANRIGGEQLPREEFVIREVEAPLYEIALIAAVNWMMGRKDWSAFVEIFGLPNSVVIMPANIPTGKEEEYRAAAEKVADGVSGALPNGSDAKFPTASVRGEAPFKSFCDAQDADVVLAGTGGRLAMLTAEKGGLGDGPSQQHEDAFDEIAQADARKINETLQRDFDRLELAAEFPGQPVLAYFELTKQDADDITTLSENVVRLESTGLQCDVGEISERTGLKLTRLAKPAQMPSVRGNPSGSPKPNLPEVADPALPAGAPIQNRAGATDTFAQAVAQKLDPVAALLNRITDIQDDAQMVATLQTFLNHADQLNALITADVSKAQLALEQITAPALAKGLEGKTA